MQSHGWVVGIGSSRWGSFLHSAGARGCFLVGALRGHLWSRRGAEAGHLPSGKVFKTAMPQLKVHMSIWIASCDLIFIHRSSITSKVSKKSWNLMKIA